MLGWQKLWIWVFVSVHPHTTTLLTEFEWTVQGRTFLDPSGLQNWTGQDSHSLPVMFLKKKRSLSQKSLWKNLWDLCIGGSEAWGCQEGGSPGMGVCRWLHRSPGAGGHLIQPWAEWLIPLPANSVQLCHLGGSFILQAFAKSLFYARCQRWAGMRVSGWEGSCHLWKWMNEA